jgi:hypothetical protein
MHHASWPIDFDTSTLVPTWRSIVEATFRERNLPIDSFEVDKHPRGGLKVEVNHDCPKPGPCPWTREVFEHAAFDATEALRAAWSTRNSVTTAGDRFVVFYSWQSGSSKTNRNLIESGLEKALKALKKDDTVDVEPVMDRDTAGVSGSPDIATTIFAKIEKASAFVADVSLVLRDVQSQRASPNPNVLLELGYAAHAIGWDRVLLVANEHFGPVEDLPFDLRARRVTTYRMGPDDAPADARKLVASKLEDGLRHAIALGMHGQGQPTRRDQIRKLLSTVSKANNSSFAPVMITSVVRYPGVSREEYAQRLAATLPRMPYVPADIPNPKVMQIGPCKGEVLHLCEVDDDAILVEIPPRSLRVRVPLEHVEKVWRHQDRLLGMTLGVAIVVPDDPFTQPITLESP